MRTLPPIWAPLHAIRPPPGHGSLTAGQCLKSTAPSWLDVQ